MCGGAYHNEPIDSREAPADVLVAAELRRRVLDAVEMLPSGQRDAVMLFYLLGHSHAETAALLGTPVGAVKTRLHKARAALRHRLSTFWREEQMVTEQSTEPRPMRVADVRARPPDDANASPNRLHVVILEEIEGGRVLPIWVGPTEGLSLALLFEKVDAGRPLTPKFMAGLLEAASATLEQVQISRLEQDVFYAEAEIKGPTGTRTIDARPSDALALALATNAPIVAEVSLLERREQLQPTHPQEMQMHLQATMNAAAIVAEAQALRATQLSPSCQPSP
jgi:bifunctional DNase/RNase